jgi:hypothetical protein
VDVVSLRGSLSGSLGVHGSAATAERVICEEVAGPEPSRWDRAEPFIPQVLRGRPGQHIATKMRRGLEDSATPMRAAGYVDEILASGQARGRIKRLSRAEEATLSRSGGGRNQLRCQGVEHDLGSARNYRPHETPKGLARNRLVSLYCPDALACRGDAEVRGGFQRGHHLLLAFLACGEEKWHDEMMCVSA